MGIEARFTVRGLLMTFKKELVLTAMTSLFIGALVTGSAAYFWAAWLIKDQFVSSFYANAIHAQFEVRALVSLRSGNTAKVIKDLELMLDGHTMQLAQYETAVAPPLRVPFVYRTLAEVRAYRSQFPAHFEYPLQQATYERALDLGKKAGG
jgi:hypothetical protein